MRLTGLAPLAVIILIAHAASAIYMGTAEGYVFNVTGSLVKNASVSVYVLGCSGTGCSGTMATDSGGYYVVANLNLPAGGNVACYASKGGASGTASGTADQFFAAYVNIIICQPPDQPALTAEPNTHYSSASLQWASGTDNNSLTTHDEFQLDAGTVSNETSPKNVSGLSYSSHTWRLRTCNNWCCSGWADNTFSVYNNPPSSPVLVSEPDTQDTNATLQWASGTDSDGDPAHDEFQLNSDPIENATSPKNVSGLGSPSYNTWRVRTCDSLGACSSWASDSFFAGIGAVTPTPTVTPAPTATPVPTTAPPIVIPYCPYGVPSPTALPCLVPFPPTPTPTARPSAAPTPAVSPPPGAAPCYDESVKNCEDARGKEKKECEDKLTEARGECAGGPIEIWGGQCEYDVPVVGKVSCELLWIAVVVGIITIAFVFLTRGLAKSVYTTLHVIRRFPFAHVTVKNQFLAVLLAAYALATMMAALSVGEPTQTGAVVAWYGKFALGAVLAACIAAFAILVFSRLSGKQERPRHKYPPG
ncbi:MAG: hypothetical protein NTY90_02190 [Candidatus Micrarchaeota archaeon]|nr:hypothetical protein [Candidatus Micrarchaeota archaeon]